MAIFNELGKKLSQTTQNAVKGTKDLAEIARLNSQISQEQNTINDFYMQIGKKYYELNHAAVTDEDFAPACASITVSIAKIAELQYEIQKIKNIKKCSGCGTEIAMDLAFCGTCGYDTRTDSDVMTPVSQGLTCPGCSKELEEGTAFCTGCGQKI